jgi:hypothetical protein
MPITGYGTGIILNSLFSKEVALLPCTMSSSFAVMSTAMKVGMPKIMLFFPAVFRIRIRNAIDPHSMEASRSRYAFRMRIRIQGAYKGQNKGEKQPKYR